MSNRIKMMNKLRQALYGKPGREVKQPTQSDISKTSVVQSDQKDRVTQKRRMR
jgi:hypothetical protein